MAQNTRKIIQSTDSTNGSDQMSNEPDSLALLLVVPTLPFLVVVGAAVVLALVVVVRALVVVSAGVLGGVAWPVLGGVAWPVLGGVAWLLQFEPGDLYNALASMISLCSEAAEIQISAQDPIFTQAPVGGWVGG